MADNTQVDEWMFRAMIEENGQPKLGSTALTLGIRPGHDIGEVDSSGAVHRPSFQPGGRNGLSCAPAIHMLPHFTIPASLGGRNKKTEVWKIKMSDLGSDLTAQRDGPRHISIGPANTMPLVAYVAAIEQTAAQWVKVT